MKRTNEVLSALIDATPWIDTHEHLVDEHWRLGLDQRRPVAGDPEPMTAEVLELAPPLMRGNAERIFPDRREDLEAARTVA